MGEEDHESQREREGGGGQGGGRRPTPTARHHRTRLVAAGGELPFFSSKRDLYALISASITQHIKGYQALPGWAPPRTSHHAITRAPRSIPIRRRRLACSPSGREEPHASGRTPREQRDGHLRGGIRGRRLAPATRISSTGSRPGAGPQSPPVPISGPLPLAPPHLSFSLEGRRG